MGKFLCFKKGFSLVEVLIGITILTMAIVSTSALVNSLMQSNRRAAETLQSYYLAQEAVETMRNQRDQNYFQGKKWREGLSGSLSADVMVGGKKFEREVEFSESDDEAKVKVTVFPEGRDAEAFVLETLLTDWRK